jgi:hypothetical protein
MSAFLFCLTAWLAMALGMDKHHEDALGREASPALLRRWRQGAWLILLLSLWLAMQARPEGRADAPASLGIALWAVALSAAALAATAAMTWVPRRAVPLGAGSLALAALAYACGW